MPKIEIDERQIPPLRTPDRKAQNTSPYLGGEYGARAGRERHDQPSESMSWELVDINRRFDGIEELCRRQDEKLDSLKSTLQNFLEIFLDMMRGNGGQNLAERPRGAAGS